MNTVTQTPATVNPYPRLLSQVPAAIQAEVKTLLIKGTTYQPAYGPLRPNDLTGRAANGHILQVNWNEAKQQGGVGCLTCTRAYEAEKGHSAGSAGKLIDNCPACYAAKIEMIARRAYRYDGPLFETAPLPASVDRGSLLDWVDDKPAAQPAPSPAAQIAADLTAEYPNLASRINKALELVEAGVVEFPQYDTRHFISNGNSIMRECDCPDATHRPYVTAFGAGCKHCLAQEIRHRLDRQFNAVKVRKIEEYVEKSRQQAQANAAAYEFALRPDALNRAKDNRRVFYEGRR